MKKTILITGINGFLGSHLAKALCADYKIIGLEKEISNLYRLENHSFEVYTSDQNSIESIFNSNKIDTVIHTATIYNDSISDLIKTNILLPIRLYELSKISDVQCFINTDTFFNNPKYDYKYLGSYTLSKRHIYEWLELKNERVKIINMKLEHMYGPEDSRNKFVPTIIRQLTENVGYIKLTEGLQKRDFIFIDDVVTAFENVLKKINDFKNPFTEIPIGNGHSITLREFVETAKQKTRSKSKLMFGALPYRENEIMESHADTSILNSLGWENKYSIEEGLLKTLREDNLVW